VVKLAEAQGVEILPAAGNHAIELMALAVDWAKPLSVDEIQTIRSIYEQSDALKAKLPKATPVGSFHFQFIQPQVHGASPLTVEPGVAGGLDLQCFRSNGQLAWAIAVRPDFIACQCSVYDGWNVAKTESITLLSPFLKAIFRDETRKVAGFGLQYQDAFFVKGDIANFSLERMLIRRPNKLLPDRVFDRTSLWHVHQGWFSPSPDGRRTLNIFNVDFAGANREHFLRLSGQHRTLALSYSGQEQPLDLTCLSDALDHMHRLNKEVLSDTLLESVLQRIGLTG
jgi:uncharacterized protein (TIGR04255 family)